MQIGWLTTIQDRIAGEQAVQQPIFWDSILYDLTRFDMIFCCTRNVS